MNRGRAVRKTILRVDEIEEEVDRAEEEEDGEGQRVEEESSCSTKDE